MLNEAYSPSAKPVFYRTYSRSKKETWQDVCDRTITALISLGKLTKTEGDLIRRSQEEFKVLSSGRWLWCGGTDWLKKPENVYGAYNCSSTNIDGWEALALIMNLAMQGCGTGAVLEDKYIKNFPVIRNHLTVEIVNLPGSLKLESRHDDTIVSGARGQVNIFVGDSRKGWVDSYLTLLELSSREDLAKNVKVFVCLGAVRNSGEKLRGFGGTANPIALAGMYGKLAKILNGAIGRQLTALELCKLIDEASVTIVAGNIRRSAGMRQGSPEDIEFATAKDNLWQQDNEGNWKIDPDKDCLRMANHTLVYHRRPTLEEVKASVTKQFHSGEGAIQWAGEAVARANVDLLSNKDLKNKFLDLYDKSLNEALNFLAKLGLLSIAEAEERMSRYATNPCGEIVGNNFFCDLAEVHLNTLDGKDLNSLKEAFKAAGLIAAVLLNDKFPDERYQKSRELDPIVGVSFTGLFDFFVNLFGESWLRWWEAGRPTGSEEDFIFGEDLDNWFGAFPKEIKDLIEDYDFTDGDGGLFKEIEQFYLTLFKDEAHKAVWEYCDTHNLKRPNRCTTVQPAGCLDKTAIRVFDQGLIYLDELISPGSGDRDGIGLSVRDGVEVNSAIANQPLNLIKITLKNGRILRMTPNHRLSVGGDWVRADELVRGMKIDFSLGEYSKTEDALLLPINPEHYTREYRELERGHGRGVLTKTISTPNLLNPDIAYMLGCLFGNGYMSDKPHRVRFSFGTTRMDIVSKIQNIVREYFGVEAAIDMYETKLEMCFASKQLTDWLKLNNLHKAEKNAEPDRIPLAVRQSSKETILSFFCGLIDTDGCVRKEGSLSIDSASEKFIRNLQQIGEAIGLSFSVFHNTKGENKQGQKNMWGLCLSRMLSTKTSIDYLNQNSIKCGEKPIPEAKRVFKFDPYQITDIEFETTPDYSFDVAVSGVDDDDSWYWQGGLKSHNTKSLLTGASPGWHPPKAARFIRRITFGRDDAVALACMDYGYSIIPSQSCKDAEGNLLNDPFDPRVTEWLVEIPTKTSWADNIGEDVDISKFSAKAQFDFYLQVQNYYATHNTSATLEIRQEEIGEYAQLLYQNIQNCGGYSSAALLARFDGGETFPRLPFEPISKEKYEDLWGEVLARRKDSSFDELLQARLSAAEVEDSQVGPAGCDSDKCLFKEVGK
jgi:ribonucleotide reductase class II